jgi:hypothetical protein
VAAASGLAALATLARDGRDLALANSDALLAEGLYRDLFEDGYSLADWRFSTTTFFFPDVPLYFLARPFVDDAGAALWIFAAVLFAATVLAAGYAVVATAGGLQRGLAALALAALGGIAFVQANHHGWIGAGVWLPDPYMATWHGGTCLAAFVSAALFQRWLAKPGWLIAVGLTVTGLVTTASDGAYFTMFTAPALGAWLCFARKVERRTWLYSAALLIFPPLAGRLLLRSLSAAGAIRIADPASRAIDNLNALLSQQSIDDVADILTHLSPAFWIASLLALALLGLYWQAQRRLRPTDPTAAWLTFWLALSILSQPIFTAFAGRLLYDFPWQPRYLLTALYIPFLFVLPLILAPIVGAAPRRLLATASLAVLAFVTTVTHLFDNSPVLRPTTPEFVRCVDDQARKYSLRYGLAGYFEAKPLTFYSQAGVRVNQLARDFAPYYWLNNFAWYLGNSDAAIEYDFLLWPEVRAAEAAAFYGPADRVVACPNDFQLLIYKDPLQTRFRRQFSREGLLLWRRAVGLE